MTDDKDVRLKEIIVSGIVSHRTGEPFVQILTETGAPMAQLTMAQAYAVARDITVMAARTEMDAMVLKFFRENEFPEQACVVLLQQMRDFRSQLDAEVLMRRET